MKEIWKSIEGYEGFYEVSNLGRVKSLSRYVSNGTSVPLYVKERILKQWKDKKGYCTVVLGKEGKYKTYAVHRLVANAFILNPNNLPCVNHKDENPSNNFVDNLEWCTYRYNLNYGTAQERRIAKQRETLNSREASFACNGELSKPVIQYSKNGDYINEYPSMHEVQRQLGISASGVMQCCKGNTQYRQCGGYIWRYKGDNRPITPILSPKIYQYSKTGELINIFSSITEASRKYNISRTSINECVIGNIRTSGGYIWIRK